MSMAAKLYVIAMTTPTVCNDYVQSISHVVKYQLSIISN